MKSFFCNRGTELTMSHNEKLKAFEALAFEHTDAIYCAAWRMTRNRLDAEDLVQEAYLRAFRFFDYFQPGTNFKAWLFTILRNTFINHYRQRKAQPTMLAFDKVAFMIPDTNEGTPISRYLFRDREINYRDMFTDQIQAALDRLSDEFRMVVLLADIEEFRYQEIAGIMDCPIGTVMSRLSRARRQLQKYLRDYANREGYIGRTVMHEKPTPIKESRGRIRHAVAAVVMLLMFVLFGKPVAAQIDLNARPDLVQRPFYANVLYFRANNTAKTLTEVYVEIPYTRLAFVKADADYAARVEVAVIFDDETGFQIHGNTLTETIRTQNYAATISSRHTNCFYFPFLIEPGRYALRLIVTDENTGVQIPTTCKINVPAFQNPQLQISSLKLARDLEMIAADSTLPKKGYNLMPNVPHIFVPETPYFIYFEIYHLEPAAPQADSFQVFCHITRGGKEICSSMHHYPKAGAHVAVTAKLNLRNLAPGIYMLRITVTDQNGEHKAKAVAQFYIINSLNEFSENKAGHIL